MYKYSHGGNAAFESGNEDIIDLSANINPLGIPDKVRDAIIGEIPRILAYPDSSSGKLRKKLAEFENVDPDWLFCGNGASDIIFRLPRVLQAEKVLITAPTFSDYERAADSFGSKIIYHALSAANAFDMDKGFIDAVQAEKPDLVYICNPNNPTGRLTDARFIKDLLDSCRENEAFLAVDECFLEFTEKAEDCTSKDFLSDYPKLVILKAFTKLFTMPGVRLGYAICSDPAIIDSFYFHGPDWPVSNLAQAAGIAALDDADRFVRATVEYVSKQRKHIENELSKLGCRTFESSANYVFFQSPFSFDLREELNKEGIRIRSCSNYRALDDSYYRIAVSTEENNAKLLSAMEKIAASRQLMN